MAAFINLEDSPMFQKQVCSMEGTADELKDRCQKLYKGVKKFMLHLVLRMEVAEIGRKKMNQNVRHQQQPGELMRHQYRDARLIAKNEKMVEELQQQMFEIEKRIPETQLNLKNAKSKASYTLDYGWSYGESSIYRSSELDRKKMELEKLTFAHGAYRDKKAVLYFSPGEKPEVNIHNLNYRMLHEARSMGGERRLLNMVNPNKHSNSGFSLKELDQQIWRLGHGLYLMKCRFNNTSDPDEIRKKLMELQMEREQLFCNVPVKGFLWNSLPSTMDLRNQIQSLETSGEKRREKRKKINTNRRELQKAEDEIKSLRKTMERIRQRKQKALQTLSHHKESFEKPA